MHKRLAAASCISRSRSPSVWISDALLAETFHRFCHPKRYGSNVPGPLEAQRRAAKRKNTSLAFAGSGGAPIDPSILFGSSTNHTDWWRGPKDIAAVPATPSPILPSWMFPFSNKTKNPLPPVELENASAHKVSRGLSEQQLQSLARCRTLSEVKEWGLQEEFNLREDKHAGRAILNHILEGKLENLQVQPIAAYISDPTFHHSGTSFILDLIRAIVSHAWDPASWNILRQSICSATELGLISVDDLRSMIDVVLNASGLRLSIAGLGYRSRRERAKLYLVSGILNSLDRSSVLQITDLGPSLLSKLFSKFRGHAYLGWCRRTLWRLLPWASKSYVPIIGQLVSDRLSFERGHRVPTKRVGQALAGRLLRADPTVLQLVLAHTTESLLIFSRETKTLRYRFMWYHWCCTLAVLGSQRYNISITKETWDNLQDLESTLTSSQRPLAFAWTAMLLFSDMRTSAKLSDQIKSLDAFENLVTSIPISTTDYPGSAVAELSNLALPHKDVLLQNLNRLSLSGEEAFYGDGSYALTDPDVALEGDITTSILNKNIQNAHFNYHRALAEVLDRASSGFPAFKLMSRRMIHKSTMSFGILCQLLESNTMLKLVLQSPPRPGTASNEMRSMDKGFGIDPGVSSASDVTSSPTESTVSTSDLPTRDQVIDLIHHLAISFTSSPVATPRATLRRVYWCYLFLRHYHVPVPPLITRALWHAGVTRYGEGGTAATLLKWLLQLIREIEGEDVARQLLWSESFRLTRTAQIDAWSRISEEEEQAVHKMLTGEFASEFALESNGLLHDADDRASRASSSAPVDFPTKEIEALLTGDEQTNQEVRNKVQFLRSQPPAEHIDELLSGYEDGDQYLRNKVRFYEWLPSAQESNQKQLDAHPIENANDELGLRKQIPVPDSPSTTRETNESLAGNEEAILELKRKISFLQSKTSLAPFWVPKSTKDAADRIRIRRYFTPRAERQQKRKSAARIRRCQIHEKETGKRSTLPVPVKYHAVRTWTRMTGRRFKPSSGDIGKETG
ncbi:hypothetical protein H2200_008277 [Cladophialophora chaetospira]|uniref:Uncharacterized protein n=1 Tax=Cladophialophora chaetospira TaxID=386627 RepID=A0AA38X5G7_9EURO|nr:hypothetical protein H2200_008277 [Cladophialophora chaetospira]